MIEMEEKIIRIFAYITNLNLMKKLTKRAKLIILLLAINALGYGVTVAYFTTTASATNQNTLILTGVKQEQYYKPNTSIKLVDYCITLIKLIKRN